jgi:hypothetical protein
MGLPPCCRCIRGHERPPAGSGGSHLQAPADRRTL